MMSTKKIKLNGFSIALPQMEFAVVDGIEVIPLVTA
jgi:hypothetical protein